MKKLIYFTLVAALIFGCAKKETESVGSIYGVITDKATGEPVRAAGVQLSPTGLNTVTGNEGQYEFIDLNAGAYTISVTKTGYTNLVNYKITVAGGTTNKGDVQLEKLPPSLRVVNDSKQDINTLDFGSATSDVTRSFSIFNDGPESLEWQLTETAEWITGVSKTEGTLNAGATQAVIITIDRDKLAGGENTTTIHITSNNGSKELTVTTIGENRTLPVLNTLEATGITATTATLNGEITVEGLPSYTERGFVYATTTMPTVENTIAKITVEINSTAKYSANITGLNLDQKYYVRAYAVNRVGTAYSSNEFVLETVVNMPSVTTQDITNKNIGNGAITFNGTVVSLGDPAYTERGFVYGTTHNPTVDDNKKTVSGSGLGAFSLNATEIAEGSIYYVRAYATNVKGAVYGEEITVDFQATMPTVETQAPANKNIGAGTATFNGNVVSLGDLAYVERGFVYALTNNPTIEDNRRVVSGTGTGVFSYNATGLAAGNIYYVRAYIINSKGTVYGDNATLDFNALMPQVTTQIVTSINTDNGTATFSGTIVNAGDPAYTERGFVYGVTHNPTIDGNKKVASGSGTGTFSFNETNISTDVTYYLRAYATNAVGTVYGDEVTFVLAATVPQVSTQAVSNKNIGAGTTTFNGTIVSVGSPVYTERGFVYATTHNPTVDDTKIMSSGSGTGAFSSNLTGLSEGNVYYIRAYAVNSKGAVYGEEVISDFNAVMPVVTTQAVSDVTETSVRVNGLIESIGDPVYTERGFVYGTMHNPTVEDDTRKTVSGSGTGEFFVNITDLVTGTTYYARAYARNSKGTVYGQEVNFVPNDPNVVVLSVAGLMVQKTDINGDSRVEWATGNSLCENSTLSGYTDWRLPTKDELMVLYNERNTIGGFATSDYAEYWSSSPSYSQNFINGHQFEASYAMRCRCVRDN
jgi:hypothetical protein